jgi:hypothetical protein
MQYVESNTILLRGRIPGYKWDDIQLLPSSTTKIWGTISARHSSSSVSCCWMQLHQPLRSNGSPHRGWSRLPPGSISPVSYPRDSETLPPVISTALTFLWKSDQFTVHACLHFKNKNTGGMWPLQNGPPPLCNSWFHYSNLYKEAYTSCANHEVGTQREPAGMPM